VKLGQTGKSVAASDVGVSGGRHGGAFARLDFLPRAYRICMMVYCTSVLY